MCQALDPAYTLEIVNKYGEDSLTYLALEQGKQIFYGTKVEGFIAYVVIKNVAVCAGNPVCQKHKIPDLIEEFKVFCRRKRLRICFCSINKSQTTLLEKGMNFIYHNVNSEYSFQTLHDYKRKFSPTCWEPRYIAVEAGLSAMKAGYVMIKARSEKKIWGHVFKGLWQVSKSLLPVKGWNKRHMG